ncbi:hypothetical protein [Mycobacteroides abscessus]
MATQTLSPQSMSTTELIAAHDRLVREPFTYLREENHAQLDALADALYQRAADGITEAREYTIYL